MHNSMCIRGIVGKVSIHVKQVHFSFSTCSFTICMQAMTPKRSNVSFKSHGNFGPQKILNLATPLMCKGRFTSMMGSSQKHQIYLTLSAIVR